MVKLKKGLGKLFTNPDPDLARSFFCNKSRTMRSKLTTVEKAVRELVHEGDYLAIGGFGAVRIPTAVLHEIVRQRKKISVLQDTLLRMIFKSWLLESV